MANRSEIYLKVDEIDHLTIRYTDFGEALDRKAGIKKICRYVSEYPAVRESLNGVDTSAAALGRLGDEELCAVLVKVRAALLYKVLK